MKKLSKLVAVLVVCLMVVASVLTACKPADDEVKPNANFKNEADYIDLDAYKLYLVADLTELKDVVGKIDNTVDAAVTKAFEDGKTAINAATDVTLAKGAYKTAAENLTGAIPLADGVKNFSGLSAAEKTKILGIIEAYCVRNGMLGLSLFENGGHVMYNERIKLPTENYITGYGFGVLAEGEITADLESESNAAWKRYYHTTEVSDPGSIYYHNDQGSQIGDLYGYIGASYYTNFMNETKDGYDWVPELALSDPVPVDGLDANGQSAKWKFEIRQGLKYNTNSTKADRAAYNNREVALEDFLTPYKLMFNQANGLFRGTEAANATGANAIKGAKAYYEATAKAKKGILTNEEADFSQVGVKAYEKDDKWYFEYELGAPVTMFYARYYISSSLYAPVPAEFLSLVGVENFLGYSQDKKTTPVDNSLSLGAYTLERWDTDQQIVFKKNPNYVYADTKYKIEGIHVKILKAAAEDKEANIKEFLAGKIDATGIPDTYLAQYSSDSRTKTTAGESVIKLNLNALDQESWIKLFGVNGTYSQTTEENYWQVKPVLSNAHFRSALSYALNRNDLATVKGYVPSVNYFSSNYMSDPENGIAYNATQEHKTAVDRLLEGTNGGYSLELARDYFRMALDELEADGLITPGTSKKPTVITLEVAWQAANQEESYHKYIKQYLEGAFNDKSVTKGFYELECKFWVGETYLDTYDKIMTGQFDIGFGSISGNPLDPLSFFNVNSTDPAIAGNFTLNWAIDTNSVTEALVYGGQRWSFDALYTATQENAIVDQGKLVKSSELTKVDYAEKADGSFDVTLELTFNKLATLELQQLVIFGGDGDAYKEWKLDASYYTVKTEGGKMIITLTIPKAEIDKVPADENQGIDIYYSVTVEGVAADTYKTAHIEFKKVEKK